MNKLVKRLLLFASIGVFVFVLAYAVGLWAYTQYRLTIGQGAYTNFLLILGSVAITFSTFLGYVTRPFEASAAKKPELRNIDLMFRKEEKKPQKPTIDELKIADTNAKIQAQINPNAKFEDPNDYYPDPDQPKADDPTPSASTKPTSELPPMDKELHEAMKQNLIRQLQEDRLKVVPSPDTLKIFGIKGLEFTLQPDSNPAPTAKEPAVAKRGPGRPRKQKPEGNGHTEPPAEEADTIPEMENVDLNRGD